MISTGAYTRIRSITVYTRSFNWTIMGIVTTFIIIFLTSKSVTVRAINIIPFVLVVFKETKSMNAVLVVEIVWLPPRPIMEVIWCPITPHECSFSVDVRQAQPRLFAAVYILNINIFLLALDTGKIGSQSSACPLAATPRITGRYFTVAISFEIHPVILANI